MPAAGIRRDDQDFWSVIICHRAKSQTSSFWNVRDQLTRRTIRVNLFAGKRIYELSGGGTGGHGHRRPFSFEHLFRGFPPARLKNSSDKHVSLVENHVAIFEHQKIVPVEALFQGILYLKFTNLLQKI